MFALEPDQIPLAKANLKVILVVEGSQIQLSQIFNKDMADAQIIKVELPMKISM